MKTAAFLPARDRGTVDDMSTETRERAAGEDDSRSRDGFGPRFVAATSFGSMLNPVNSSIIAVALVSIGHAFGATTASTTWLISALYLATAIGQPTMGRLADPVGPRRVYLAGTAAVAAGGLIGWAGWSLGSLVGRVVIGLGTSASYPAAMAMVRRQSRRLRREPPPSVLGALAIAGAVTLAVVSVSLTRARRDDPLGIKEGGRRLAAGMGAWGAVRPVARTAARRGRGFGDRFPRVAADSGRCLPTRPRPGQDHGRDYQAIPANYLCVRLHPTNADRAGLA
jgi:hypothetical protein